MRIAFIGQKGVFLGNGGGGVETHVAEISTRMVERGHSVSVYARKKYCNPCPKRLNGVVIRYLPTIYSKNWEAIIHTFLSTIDVLFRRVDVIHYQGVGPSLLSWIPKLFRPRVTIIATFHARDKMHLKWGLFGRVALRVGEWTAHKIPDATISVSHSLQVVSREEFGVESIFIPNGAEIALHRSQSELRELGLKKNEYILSVGRILPVKGIHYLIKAFRRSSTKKKLVIVGDTTGFEDYSKELHSLANGDDRIMFLGRQTGNALQQLFTHAYIFVQPSESEGLPIVVLEAMGNGTAVLVSDIPGNIEAIHRAGFTFENKNVNDLFDQLEHLLKNPDLILRARRDVKKIVDEYFNWDTITDQTLDVYRSVRH